MLLRYFYDERLAQASYLVGCVKTGEALVVDPMRDIAPYIDLAQKEGLRITHIAETHIHADFVSGSRELAAHTDATIYVSDTGPADWKYGFVGNGNVVPVVDGDAWQVGNIWVEVMATPGHTPEHISFIVTDMAAANAPIGIFTGDFVFVGDVGRPDLLETAAGFVGTKEPGARQQFHSVQRLKRMPDYLQLWPAHGAGSACGKALGAIPSTTLGYERRFNPAFQFTEEALFVRWLLEGQPEPPKYFARMKQVNKAGPTLLKDINPAAQQSRVELDAALKAGHLVIDLRSGPDYARAHVHGTVSVPATDANFSTYVGWFVKYDEPLYLIVPDADQSRELALIKALQAIGIDTIAGVFGPDAVAGRTEQLPQITARALAQRLPRNGLTIIDVRGASEFNEIHITGARHIPLGYLPDRLAEVPQNEPVVVQCASGYRSQIAASVLRRQGFANVLNLVDGTDIWATWLPTETGLSLSHEAAVVAG